MTNKGGVMNTYDVKRFGLLLSKQAEMKFMEEANIAREELDQSHAYGKDAFAQLQLEIEEIVYKHDYQL